MNIKDAMASYRLYHKNKINIRLHKFGIPLAVFSLLLPMCWLQLEIIKIPISLGFVFFFITSIYYLRQSFNLGLKTLFITLPIFLLANWCAGLDFKLSFIIFISTFILGWTLQIIGHRYEGRRPALTDNFLQIFNAPLFLALELFDDK